MRWMLTLAGLCAAIPASADEIEVESAVYVESGGDGASRIEPVDRLMRGDRVVAILRWNAPHIGSYTITSPIPEGLAVRSATHPSVEYSTDDGQSWRRPADLDNIPRGATHLRWRARGEGRLSYRAVVR